SPARPSPRRSTSRANWSTLPSRAEPPAATQPPGACGKPPGTAICIKHALCCFQRRARFFVQGRTCGGPVIFRHRRDLPAFTLPGFHGIIISLLCNFFGKQDVAMLISLIVPCYNEEEAMPLFYREASRVAAEMEKSHGAQFEFVFIDDGSRDGTLRVARELHARDPRVRYVSFSRNFGKEAGIYAGLQAARGDYVATMDADLQDPPALLPAMLDTLLGGEYDCAATRRTTRKGEPPLRS